MDAAKLHHGQAVTSQYPFNEWLARKSLTLINQGPDGLESLRHAQCGMRILEDDRKKSLPVVDRSKCSLMTETKTSPVFRLPKNVRLKIYAFAVTYSEPISIRKNASMDPWYNDNGERLVRTIWRFFPPLLRTCRQLQYEGAPIYYEKNTFWGTIRNTDISEITDWIAETDRSHLRVIQNLIIRIEPTSFADLLDMNTADKGDEICKLARKLIPMLLVAGISNIQIDLPKLKHIGTDAELMGFDIEPVEAARTRWVLELGSQLTRSREEDRIVRKMEKLTAKRDGKDRAKDRELWELL